METESHRRASSPSVFYESYSLTTVSQLLNKVSVGGPELTRCKTIDPLRFLQKAIDFAHLLHRCLGPSMLFNDGIRFFTHFLDVFWMNSQIVQGVSQGLSTTSGL